MMCVKESGDIDYSNEDSTVNTGPSRMGLWGITGFDPFQNLFWDDNNVILNITEYNKSVGPCAEVGDETVMV